MELGGKRWRTIHFFTYVFGNFKNNMPIYYLYISFWEEWMGSERVEVDAEYYSLGCVNVRGWRGERITGRFLSCDGRIVGEALGHQSYRWTWPTGWLAHEQCTGLCLPAEGTTSHSLPCALVYCLWSPDAWPRSLSVQLLYFAKGNDASFVLESGTLFLTHCTLF